jgi:hypothetical protein
MSGAEARRERKHRRTRKTRFPMRGRRADNGCMRIALLLALAWVAAGCQALPEDHVLRERLDETGARLRHGLDPSRFVTPEVERVAHLRETATALLPWAGDERQRLGHIRETTVELAAREVAGPRRAAQTAVEVAQHERDRLGNLTREDSALRTLLDADDAAARLAHAAHGVPALLGSGADPRAGDPERYRDDGAPRRETWGEWFLLRVWF